MPAVTPAKGDKGGECNRGACRNTDAYHFNKSTRKWYCEPCAQRINIANHDDAHRLYGGPLCEREVP